MSIILFKNSGYSGHMLNSKFEHDQMHGSLTNQVILIQIAVNRV